MFRKLSIRENLVVDICVLRPSVLSLGGDVRESDVSPTVGGVCYKSCDVSRICATRVFFGGKLRKKSRDQVVKSKLVYFRNLFSSILSINICDRSAQFLVNCFEKNVMATNNSGFNSIQPICLHVSEERRERERSEKAYSKN